MIHGRLNLWHVKELPKWQKHEYTEQTGFSTVQ